MEHTKGDEHKRKRFPVIYATFFPMNECMENLLEGLLCILY